jgi:hypothetical protein
VSEKVLDVSSDDDCEDPIFVFESRVSLNLSDDELMSSIFVSVVFTSLVTSAVPIAFPVVMFPPSPPEPPIPPFPAVFDAI